MPLIKVKPAEGARIRQPNRNFRVMPAEGDIVDTDDTYYSRLLLTGDLEPVETVTIVVAEDKPSKKDK